MRYLRDCGWVLPRRLFCMVLEYAKVRAGIANIQVVSRSRVLTEFVGSEEARPLDKLRTGRGWGIPALEKHRGKPVCPKLSSDQRGEEKSRHLECAQAKVSERRRGQQ